MYKRNGKYYADFLYDGKRYVKSLKTGSVSVAKELEQKFRVEVMTGKYQEKQERKKRNVPLKTVIDDYIRLESEQKKKPSSVARDKDISKHLKKAFGNKGIMELSVEDITRYQSKRLEKVKGPTINRDLSLLKTVYNWYKKQSGLKIDNPVEAVSFFKENQRDRVLSEEEEQAFFAKGKPLAVMAAIVKLALYTGMRRGEILNLKKSDVILPEVGHGEIRLHDTKNGDNRTIPLNQSLSSLIRAEIEKHPGIEYVFPENKETIRKRFEAACKRAGIQDFHFHDLRHSFASRMAAAGHNVFLIMELTGHRDMKTARRYCNPTKQQLRGIMPEVPSIPTTAELDEQQEIKKESKVNALT